MTKADSTVRLADARRLIASGYTREVRQANGLSLRQCAAAIDRQVSFVTLLRWERDRHPHIPTRKVDGAIAYVDFIRRVASGAA